MKYRVAFESILLPEWKGWDGNGVSSIPARNVILNDGAKGCVLIGSEGICIYKIPSVDLLNTEPRYEENTTLVGYTTNIEHLDKLYHLVPASILDEIYTVYNNYVMREHSCI